MTDAEVNCEMNPHTDLQQYEYDAFISYSHLDKEAAAAFQRRLERYRIPKEIQAKRNNRSDRLKIFRDETDLPAGSLTGTVCEALDSCRKLIVICSSVPAAEGKEKYEWVTKEIQYLIDKSRVDDILPVLLDGDRDAMPANLKRLRKEQFITDVSQLKKRTAFLKILSGVLGTDFDTLVKRDKKQRLIKRGALAASFCAFCCVISALCFYYFWPHTAYYADYTIRFGKPEGINRLTKAQCAAGTDIFAITITRSKHEIRLEHINSAGLVSTDTSENHLEQIAAAVYSFLYDGQVDTVTYLDETGNELYAYSYAPDLTYSDIIASKDDARWLTLPAESGEDSIPVRTNISRCQLEFDEAGFLSRRMYAVDRQNAVNDIGIGGESCKYDPQGRLLEIAYLDTDESPNVDKHGIAGKTFAYDSAGRISRIEYYGADGRLINNTARYAVASYQYHDVDERSTTICYYNAEGAPAVTADGYAQEVRVYNDKGFLISCAYFDVDRQPVRGPYRFHKIEIVRDDMGREKSSAYLDSSGTLVLTPEHYAIHTKQYNAKGLVTDEFYYGKDGQLNLTTTGSCHIVYAYDEQGNLTEISHHGLDDRLIFSSDGYAIMKLDYADGLQKSERYFGVEEEPILGKEGYHKREFLYDRRNNITEIRLTGIMGQLTLCSDGYALRKLDYDNAGNITSDAYFDDYEQATYRSGLYSKITMKYDEHGHRTLTNWLNPDGTPANQSSYSSREVQYDSIGREEKISYYLLDELRFMQEYEYRGGNPSVRTDYLGDPKTGLRRIHRYNERGYEVATENFQGDTLSSRSICEYDEYGNRTQTTHFNEKNEQISSVASSFNSYGLPTKTSYYGADGQLSREVNISEHVAVVEAEYDNYNLKVARRCYDENGHPLRIISDGKETYACLTMTYDENGNCVESVFYDENGAVYQSIRQKYDTYNRELERTYFDAAGNQLVRKEVQYDQAGNLISSALYDRSNHLQADPSSGVAKILFTNDCYGYVIGEEFYGDDGLPIAAYGAYHKYLITRENGRSVEIRYYGTDGQLTLNHDGYAVEKFTYDERGNEIGRAFFDETGEPVLLKWRFSRYEVQYDDRGQLTEYRFFDSLGREVSQVDGHLSMEFFYINNVPKRMLFFNGNDGSSLMGDLEIKLYIPLQEYVKPDDDATDPVDTPPVSDEDKNDTSFVEEQLPQEEPEEEAPSFSSRDYITAVNDYVRAIEHFEGTEIMDVMEQSFFNAAAAIVANQLGTDISAYKIYHFYATFYGEQLAALKTSLQEKYGSDIYITYEILSEHYYPADQIVAANQSFQNLGIDDLTIQQMVTLDIAYTISGSNGQGLESGGFLGRQLVLIQVGGRWGIGTGEEFPSPPQDQLIALYTDR